jgi:ArsR family transcriptional regulator, arsenate/arsenite/antimonite-responsive transcriptional repressor
VTSCGPAGVSCSMSVGEAERTAALCRAFGDSHRVLIVSQLAASSEPLSVCDLTGPLGIAQPTVSHHLKKLLKADIIRRERRGTWSYYSLNSDAIQQLSTCITLLHPAIVNDGHVNGLPGSWLA